jgi:hypothetical protein
MEDLLDVLFEVLSRSFDLLCGSLGYFKGSECVKFGGVPSDFVGVSANAVSAVY